MKKKLLALIFASILALGAVPSVSFAEGYLTRHVLDGWIDGTRWAYDVNKDKYKSFETEHFQIFWGENGPASYKVTESFLKNCERVFENCWDKFVVEMGMTPPTTSNLVNGDHTTQYKINAIIMNTGIDGYGEGWAFGGIDGEGYPYFMCDADAMTDWVVPHEMGHVMHFAQGRNAWENNSYLGPWYEAIGNWFREQYLYDETCYPEGSAYRTDLSALYLRAGSLMAVNGRAYYEAWPFLQYLTDNPDGLPDFGETFIAKLLNYRPSSYDSSFYEVLAANSTTSVADTVGYFASHMATMDFKQKTNYNLKIAEMYRNGWLYWQQRYTIPESLGGGVYRVPTERTPQTYGYNIIPLTGTGEVSVRLNGQSDLEGADWRARLIVEGTDGVTRYSELFKSGMAATVTVNDGEELYLSVAATPAVDKAQKFGIGGWTTEFSEANLPYESKNQYPYTFTLEGAVPAKRPRGTTAMGRLHENGGGFVALTANVAESAYVGPNAQVLGWAKVSDNAVIDGNAIISEGAAVSGNAYVGGNAVVMGYAAVSGNARVTESALIYGSYKVSGNATVKGQAILLGNGTATGQAIAYGDLFEDEGKTIVAGAFSGYHGVNTNYGYASQTGDNTFSRPYFDKLQTRYEFNGDFRDSLGYSDMYAYDEAAPELSEGCAVFEGDRYLVTSPAVFSYDNAELRLRVKYDSGSIFDLDGIVLGSNDGHPSLRLGDSELVLDTAYSGGWDDIRITFLDGIVTLSCGGESQSLEIGSLHGQGGVGYIGRSSEGDYFRGSIDYLRVFLPGGETDDPGELPNGLAPVFEAAGAEDPLTVLTTDNNSAWCGWQTEAQAVTAGTALTVPAGGSVELSSPTYGKDVFVLEFTPYGDNIYPDHALLDGSGKYICAHRFASDAYRIYPGRGEQNFCGSENVTDTAGQKRLGSFIAEAVYYGSAIAERGAAGYADGETVRIIVQNTEWSDELSAALKGAVNKSAANLSSVKNGDSVYTVTYAVVNDGLARPVSMSCYKGSVSGFGGIKSFGTWNDKSVSCGGLKIWADEVPTQLTAHSSGVIVTNAAEGTLVFASYDGDALEKASTAETAGYRLTSFFPLPEDFPEEADVFLLSSLTELSPLTKPAKIQETETVWTSSGQNASAFHQLDERSGKAVYSFEFVDNGSKDSGILLGSSSTLNAQSGNYFASGSIVLLFSGGQLHIRDASAKTAVSSYTVGERVAVRIEADIEAKVYDLYVNGALASQNVGFRVPVGSINTLALVENGGGKAFDVFGFKIS